ncbi:DNA-methyltransferase [Nocardioides terrigena]|uniref:DNA-methyltransferase n=1 Tax=Nocardioides terrigena TaxID=424797 RepID=UPI000D305637|nr:site-specific DNA-methyltransferase [Nocardioides terrigena]
MSIYYQDDLVTLHHGDCRDVLGGVRADVCVTDPPYGETSISWDVWPVGWVEATTLALPDATSMWCFGSMRMFLERSGDFAGWRLSQDVVWRKPRARSTATDRFARIHEHALHWYRGPWGEVYHQAQRVPYYGKRAHVPAKAIKGSPGELRPMASTIEYSDDGTRLTPSILEGTAGDPRTVLHPTQKPLAVLAPLIEYACPPGGIVLDPFAGSGSTLDAARSFGRRAVGIEADERYCEIAAKRLSQDTLFGGAA